MAEESAATTEAGNSNEGTTESGTAAPPSELAWLGDAASDADTAGFVQTKGWKAPTDVVKSYRNLEKLVGHDKAGRTVVLPGENATPEERAAFFDRLGRPSKPEEYDLPVPEENGSAEFADWARSQFHELGLTADQGKALTERWNEFAEKSAKGQQESYEATVEKDTVDLQREWGAKYDANVNAAKQAAKEFGLEVEQVDKLESALGFGGLMRFMANVGSKLGEHNFETGENEGRSFGGAMTPAEANKELQRLMSDPKFMDAWTNRRHPEHQAALDKKARLTRMAVGEKP